MEGDGGRFRRNHLVQLLEVATLVELNELMLAAFIEDPKRTIVARRETVGEARPPREGKLNRTAGHAFATAAVRATAQASADFRG